MRIIHEDDHLLALDKPAGQPVIAARGAAGPTLQEDAAKHTAGGIWVVHRIDRETSGIVLFAKDAPTHRTLCLEFESRRVKKIYRALALGKMAPEGTIDSPLREFGSGRIAVAAGGKPSVTRYRVLREFSNASLLEIDLLTGRRHQIRAHLYSIGHPVLGDAVYGNPRPVAGAPRLMLHAHRIELDLDDRRLMLISEPPDDFNSVVARQ